MFRTRGRSAAARSSGRARAGPGDSPAPAWLCDAFDIVGLSCTRRSGRPGRTAGCGPGRSAWQRVDSQGKNMSAAESRPGAGATGAACSCPTAGCGRTGRIPEAGAAASGPQPIGFRCNVASGSGAGVRCYAARGVRQSEAPLGVAGHLIRELAARRGVHRPVGCQLAWTAGQTEPGRHGHREVDCAR